MNSILKHIFLYFALFIVAFLGACKQSPQHSASPLDSAEGADSADVYDMDEIEEAGELIAATLSGPESYYQYHNVEMGLQYLLAERFANSQGVRIRIEVAQDTAELFHLLKDCKVDLIAYELPRQSIKVQGMKCAGVYSEKAHTSWAVRSSSPMLEAKLKEWFTPALRDEQQQAMAALMKKSTIHRSTRIIPYVPVKNGTISPYDALFARHSPFIGWDWKLLAALCYQESMFNPKAVSWAGARGLMQIMPRTAGSYGIAENSLFEPEVNVATSVKIIKKLQSQFSDIRNNVERTKFVLAAYNGGLGHVRDAMALASKNHRNPQLWSDVSYYVLHLSEPKYYRDPVVKYGYMIGSETYNYVDLVTRRWNDFRGIKSDAIYESTGIVMNSVPVKAQKKNRFTNSSSQIKSRNDSLFILP